MELKDWINIIAIVLSPIFAVLITMWLTIRNEKRKEKMEVFKQLMISRAVSGTIDYVKTLNSLDVVFADSPKVRAAWKDLFNEYAKTNIDSYSILSKRTKLIETIAKDLGYDDKIAWDEIIANPYVPNWLVEEWKQNDLLREGQKNFVELVKNANQNTTKNNETKEDEGNK
ncbi:MAG: hypothetical protein MR368_04595 [Azospirillum sp.]|nr:hypothetical protein [Azospirillum sp.]